MSAYSGPEIPNDGLVFAYDMGNPQKSWIGRPTTNSVNAATTVLSRYNNPGFSGTVTNTGQTYKGMPIYELTFIPQNDTFIPRLASTEGFGCFHGMGIPLQANTRYMASIYVRSEHPLQVSSSQGFSNGYSNISGWNQNGTTSTRYQEDGWTRLYTQYLNSVNGYSIRTSTFQVNFTVNTTSTQTVDVNFTVPANGSGIVDFPTLHAIVAAGPNIASNGGLTGLSIVDHGLNTTDFQKLSWPSVVRLKSSDLPFNYFVRLSVPSTGGVNTTISLRANFTGYYTALTDNKFWKLTFDTTGVAVGQVLKTYWCCPMIEQHDTVYPSTFVNGTRANTQAVLDLTSNHVPVATSLTYNTNGTFNFNGSNNYIDSTPIDLTGTSTQSLTWECWVQSLSATGDIINMQRPSTGWNMCPIFASGQRFHAKVWSNANLLALNTFSIGQYYHLVLTRNNETNTNSFYVNGVLQASQTGAYSASGAANNMYFGRAGAQATNTHFNGNIPVGKIYTRSLTETEVAQNFNALRGRFGL
jgi:hypothetical protein